ncbi:MAG: DUF4199 domain-containing protein [Draconibacterium sp.]|nr:DUF4199 domain-containing protein [Draconibacterium sp.]
MEQKSTSVWKSALTSGVYLGIVFILTSVVFYVMGNPFSKVNQYLMYPIMIVGIALAQISYKKSLGGEITYGQAFGVGLLAMIFASVISGIYTYLLYEVIDPSLQEQLRIFTEEEIMKNGIPEEQLEMAVNMSAKFQKPIIMFVMAIFGGAFMGAIISLITAIFTKKNPIDEVPE